MPNMINLIDEFFLAKGGERNCFIHPYDDKKVIKVVHRNEKHNEQNKLEYKYLNFLNKKNIPFTHIPICHGFVNTNLGKGLVYDRVVDYNGNYSNCITYFLSKKTFSKNHELELINELKEYLFKNNILFIDVDLSNVFCQEIEKGKFKLIIIDGLGARRLNWRFYLYLISQSFTKYKIKKQWKKFYANYLKNTKYEVLKNEK